MNRILKRLLVLGLLSGILTAQVKSISGTIRSGATLEPLPYANVVIKDTYLGGTSNIDGYFYVSGLDYDSLVVVFSYMGYVSRSDTILYRGDSHVILPVALAPRALGGEEVLVEDSLLITPEIYLETQVPDLETKVDEISPVLDDAAEIVGYEIMLTPELPRLSFGDAGTQILIEGVPVFPTRHLYGIYPAYNLDAVKYIAHLPPGQVLQAAAPFREVTQLVYKEGNRTNFDFSGKLGLVESGLTTSGPHGLGSWYLSGRRVDFDAVYSMKSERSDSSYNRFIPDYYFYDINGKMTFDLSDATKATFTAFQTYDKQHWLGDGGMSVHSSWYTKLYSGRLQHRFSPRMSTVANIYSLRYHAFFRANHLNLGNDLELSGDLTHDLRGLGVKTVTEYYLRNNNKIQLGFGTRRYTPVFVFEDSSEIDEDASWITDVDALYAHPLPHNLSLAIGLTGLMNSNSSEFKLNPEIEVNWQPSNVYGAFVNVTQASPQLREVSLSNTLEKPVFDLLLPVDGSLSSPEILTARMGLDLVPVVGYDISAAFFLEKEKEPALMDSAWTGDISQQDLWLQQYVSAARNGFELRIEKRTPGVHARLNYRLQGGSLIDSSDAEFDLLGERNHKLDLVLHGDLGEKAGYSLGFRMASGRHFLDADGSPALSNFYHRIDAEFYRDIHISRVDGKLSLRLFNLTGAENKSLDDGAWSPMTLEERSYALLPFLPTLNLSFNF